MSSARGFQPSPRAPRGGGRSRPRYDDSRHLEGPRPSRGGLSLDYGIPGRRPSVDISRPMRYRRGEPDGRNINGPTVPPRRGGGGGGGGHHSSVADGSMDDPRLTIPRPQRNTGGINRGCPRNPPREENPCANAGYLPNNNNQGSNSDPRNRPGAPRQLVRPQEERDKVTWNFDRSTNWFNEGPRNSCGKQQDPVCNSRVDNSRNPRAPAGCDRPSGRESTRRVQFANSGYGDDEDWDDEAEPSGFERHQGPRNQADNRRNGEIARDRPIPMQQQRAHPAEERFLDCRNSRNEGNERWDDRNEPFRGSPVYHGRGNGSNDDNSQRRPSAPRPGYISDDGARRVGGNARAGVNCRSEDHGYGGGQQAGRGRGAMKNIDMEFGCAGSEKRARLSPDHMMRPEVGNSNRGTARGRVAPSQYNLPRVTSRHARASSPPLRPQCSAQDIVNSGPVLPAPGMLNNIYGDMSRTVRLRNPLYRSEADLTATRRGQSRLVPQRPPSPSMLQGFDQLLGGILVDTVSDGSNDSVEQERNETAAATTEKNIEKEPKSCSKNSQIIIELSDSESDIEILDERPVNVTHEDVRDHSSDDDIVEVPVVGNSQRNSRTGESDVQRDSVEASSNLNDVPNDSSAAIHAPGPMISPNSASVHIPETSYICADDDIEVMDVTEPTGDVSAAYDFLELMEEPVPVEPGEHEVPNSRSDMVERCKTPSPNLSGSQPVPQDENQSGSDEVLRTPEPDEIQVVFEPRQSSIVLLEEPIPADQTCWLGQMDKPASSLEKPDSVELHQNRQHNDVIDVEKTMEPSEIVLVTLSAHTESGEESEDEPCYPPEEPNMLRLLVAQLEAETEKSEDLVRADKSIDPSRVVNEKSDMLQNEVDVDNKTKSSTLFKDPAEETFSGESAKERTPNKSTNAIAEDKNELSHPNLTQTTSAISDDLRCSEIIVQVEPDSEVQELGSNGSIRKQNALASEDSVGTKGHQPSGGSPNGKSLPPLQNFAAGLSSYTYDAGPNVHAGRFRRIQDTLKKRKEAMKH